MLIPVSYGATIGLLIFTLRKLKPQDQTKNPATGAQPSTLQRLVYVLCFAYSALATIVILISGLWSIVIATFLVGPISLYLLSVLILSEYLYKKVAPRRATTRSRPSKYLIGFASVCVAIIVADLLVTTVFYIPLVLENSTSMAQYNKQRKISATKKFAADFTEYIPHDPTDEQVEHEQREYKNHAEYEFHYRPYVIRETAYKHSSTLCSSTKGYKCEVFGTHNSGIIYRSMQDNKPNSAIYMANKDGTLLNISVYSGQSSRPEDMAAMINSMTKQQRKECSPTPLGMVRLLCLSEPKDYIQYK
jgi:hypothetical protein